MLFVLEVWRGRSGRGSHRLLLMAEGRGCRRRAERGVVQARC
jgi:hypothetical protein